MTSKSLPMTYRLLQNNEGAWEHFQELAAKFEFDAAMPRADAEKMAMEAVLAKYGVKHERRS